MSPRYNLSPSVFTLVIDIGIVDLAAAAKKTADLSEYKLKCMAHSCFVLARDSTVNISFDRNCFVIL